MKSLRALFSLILSFGCLLAVVTSLLATWRSIGTINASIHLILAFTILTYWNTQKP